MRHNLFAVALAVAACASSAAQAGLVVSFTDPSGLAGEAEFTLINPTTLQVRLRNISTDTPESFDSADQILTSIAFNLPGAISITGGTVFTGPNSSSVNFDVTDVGPNANVSGEWAYGNGGGTGFGSLVNYFSAMTAGTTPFGGDNLDGPSNIDGPQGGLTAGLLPLGGLGAIQDEVIATLTLSAIVSDLSFLSGGVIVEFGSDAAFIPGVIPAPGALALLGIAGALHRRRRRA